MSSLGGMVAGELGFLRTPLYAQLGGGDLLFLLAGGAFGIFSLLLLLFLWAVLVSYWKSKIKGAFRWSHQRTIDHIFNILIPPPQIFGSGSF